MTNIKAIDGKLLSILLKAYAQQEGLEDLTVVYNDQGVIDRLSCTITPTEEPPALTKEDANNIVKVLNQFAYKDGTQPIICPVCDKETKGWIFISEDAVATCECRQCKTIFTLK